MLNIVFLFCREHQTGPVNPLRVLLPTNHVASQSLVVPPVAAEVNCQVEYPLVSKGFGNWTLLITRAGMMIH